MLPLRYESSGPVQASPGQVFAHIDDPTRLASHMRKGSWRMAGGHMNTATDAGRGQAVGSRIRVSGRVLGVEWSTTQSNTLPVGRRNTCPLEPFQENRTCANL